MQAGPERGAARQGAQDQSGRAIEAQQAGGLVEQSDLMDTLRRLDLRVFNDARLDDEAVLGRGEVGPGHRRRRRPALGRPERADVDGPGDRRDRAGASGRSAIKQGRARRRLLPAADENGEPMLHNDVARLDMDIMVSDAPDTITLDGETYRPSLRADEDGPAAAVLKLAIEMHPGLPAKRKKQLTDMIDQMAQAAAASSSRTLPTTRRATTTPSPQLQGAAMQVSRCAPPLNLSERFARQQHGNEASRNAGLALHPAGPRGLLPSSNPIPGGGLQHYPRAARGGDRRRPGGLSAPADRDEIRAEMEAEAGRSSPEPPAAPQMRSPASGPLPPRRLAPPRRGTRQRAKFTGPSPTRRRLKHKFTLGRAHLHPTTRRVERRRLSRRRKPSHGGHPRGYRSHCSAVGRRVLRRVHPGNDFADLMGEGENAIIQVKENLTKKKGDSVTFALLNRLTANATTGSDVLEGNEEDLTHPVAQGHGRQAPPRRARLRERRAVLGDQPARRHEARPEDLGGGEHPRHDHRGARLHRRRRLRLGHGRPEEHLADQQHRPRALRRGQGQHRGRRPRLLAAERRRDQRRPHPQAVST
jgi:hypothetical protein